METRKRLTVTRGNEGGGKGRKEEKGLVKDQVQMTHGHGQQGGDRLWECREGGVRGSNRGKLRQL